MNKLTKEIGILNDCVLHARLDEIEKIANRIKELAEELAFEDLRTMACKIELEARRFDFYYAIEKIKSINVIFEKAKTEEE